MGREGHNKFTVRFKFAKRKLVQTGHTSQLTENRLYCLYPIYPSAALWNPDLSLHYNLLGKLYVVFIK